MFVQRLLSAVALVIVLAISLILGGNFLLAMTAFISVIGFYEMMKATDVLTKDDKFRNVLFLVGIGGIIAYDTCIAAKGSDQLGQLCITFTILAVLIVYVFTFPKYHARQIMATIFSYMYAPVMLAFIYLTRSLENGVYLVWLIFISSWICDTCAYLVGKSIGKHKMTPRLSPKKSIEGAIGGVVGAAVVGYLYGLILQNMGMMEVSNLFMYAVIAGAGAVISQIGDLAASAIKRNYDIKDYGHLIPGHGGILDRFDSVIFTAPIVYYLSVLFV